MPPSEAGFAPTAAETPPEAAQLADAAAASGSMSPAEGPSAALAAGVSASIEQEARALAQTINPAGEAALAVMEAELALLTDRAHGVATAARTQLAAVYDSQLATIQAESQAAEAAIEQSRQQQLEAIAAAAAGEQQRLEAGHQAERQRATSAVEGAQQAVIAAGAEQAQRAETESETRATAILAEAESIATRGDPPSIEAQQKAARKIAERAASECRKTGTDVAGRLREEAQSYAATEMDGGLQDYLTQLEQQVTDAKAKVDEFVSQATADVNTAADNAKTALEQLVSQSTASFDAQRQNASAQIDAWEAQVPAALRAAADQVRPGVGGALSPFVDALTNFGTSIAAQIRGQGRAPADTIEGMGTRAREDLHAGHETAMGGVRDWQATAIEGLTSTFDGANEQLNDIVTAQTAAVGDVGGKLAAGLKELGQTAVKDIEAIVGSFQKHVQGAIDAVIEKMTSAGNDLLGKIQENQQAAVTTLTSVVNDALQSEDTLLTDARGEMTAAAAKIADKYDSLRKEAETRNQGETAAPATRIHRGIWSSITSWWTSFTAPIKQAFADALGEFWGGLLYGILETLVIVVVGALVIWGVAAGLSALIAAVAGVTIAAAKIALIIGIILLVVVVIPLLIYNRIQEYKEDNPNKEISGWTYVGLGLLGIADVTGIPFIIEAAAGQRATGGELKGWNRGYRLGQGVVMLLTVVAAAYKFLGRSPVPAKGGGPPPVDPNRPPVVDPNRPPVVDPNRPPAVDPNRPPAVDPNRPPEAPPARYDPKVRTNAELQTDLDPAPRAGETPAEANTRVSRAQIEIENRALDERFKGFGEVPRKVNMVANDAAHGGNGAHTLANHSPDIPLNRAGAAPGVKTIEGRIFGDAPWPARQNSSFRWRSLSILDSTVNDYIRGNWDQIRLDLATNGRHAANFNTPNAVAEGFFNPNQGGFGPVTANFMQTSLVRIVISVVPGSPTEFFIVTTFGNALGAPAL